MTDSWMRCDDWVGLVLNFVDWGQLIIRFYDIREFRVSNLGTKVSLSFSESNYGVCDCEGRTRIGERKYSTYP